MLEARKYIETDTYDEIDRVSEEAYRRVRAAAASGELAEDSTLSRIYSDKPIEELLDELEAEAEQSGDAFAEVSYEDVFGSAWKIVNGHGV